MLKTVAFVSVVALFGCTYTALGPADCPAESSYNTVLSPSAAFSEGSGATWAEELRFEGTLDLNPDIEVDVFIYGGGGTTSTPDWPTSLGPSSNTQLGLQSPDAILRVAANFGSDGTPADLYVALSGKLDVTSTSSTLSGTYSDVVLEHGTFNQAGNFVADADACMTTLSGAYSAAIQSP